MGLFEIWDRRSAVRRADLGVRLPPSSHPRGRSDPNEPRNRSLSNYSAVSWMRPSPAPSFLYWVIYIPPACACTCTPPLHPAVFAFVSFGVVLVRVQVRGQDLHRHLGTGSRRPTRCSSCDLQLAPGPSGLGHGRPPARRRGTSAHRPPHNRLFATTSRFLCDSNVRSEQGQDFY